MEQEIKILDFNNKELLDTFFDWTATLSFRVTGLKVNIWSKWDVAETSDEKPNIIIGRGEYWNRYIIVVTISSTPKIIAQTPNITDEQKKDLEEGIKYVARNYELFLKHYNNEGNNGKDFDDEDLIQALEEKGEYKRRRSLD